MGLHLNFTLQLDGTESETDVTARLTLLHEHARSLPLASVSDVHSLNVAPEETWNESEALLACWADAVASVDVDLEPDAPRADPETVIGFVVNPGRESEPATFALMRRSGAGGHPVDWHWRCHCKTQYASIVSDAHLITCHTALVDLLDAATRLGFRVDVLDETRYWETRDTSVLLAEVHRMNRIVAGFAGKLHDTMNGQGSLVAPIFDHPQFEHLESDVP